MNQQVNNRYREYRVAIPKPISEEIKRRAAEQKVTEVDVIRQLIAKGLVIGNAPQPQSWQQTLCSRSGGVSHVTD